MERVLAVDLLHLMASEGSYGAQVAAQLDASEVWHAYRDQKHDLFLPAGATSQVHPIYRSQHGLSVFAGNAMPAARCSHSHNRVRRDSSRQWNGDETHIARCPVLLTMLD